MTIYAHKISPACLSHMRLGRLASGDLQLSTADTEHLGHCDACSTILRRQQQDVRAMAAERVPAALLAASDAKKQRQGERRLSWSAWAVLGATVCAGLLVIPHGTRAPRVTHLKGAPSLAVSIMRGETLVVDEAPVEKVEGVRVGDRLRVRVIEAQQQLVRLELCEQEGPCSTVFSGELSQDGWIPAGIKMDTPTPTILRLRVCATGTSVEQCPPHDYTLRNL